MTKQHLTGWRLSAGNEHRVYDANGNRICDVPCGGMTGRTFDEAADVARLIASAPDMLKALDDLINSFEKHRPKAYWDAARAAVAKARGETA